MTPSRPQIQVTSSRLSVTGIQGRVHMAEVCTVPSNSHMSGLWPRNPTASAQSGSHPRCPEVAWPPEAYGPFVIDGPSVTPQMWRRRREQQPELTPEMIVALEATEEPKP